MGQFFCLSKFSTPEKVGHFGDTDFGPGDCRREDFGEREFELRKTRIGYFRPRDLLQVHNGMPLQVSRHLQHAGWAGHFDNLNASKTVIP